MLKRLCPVSPDSLPTGRPQFTHSLQGRKDIASSLCLGGGLKGLQVHEEFARVAEKWGQHHLRLILPPHPLIHRNSEVVESKGYRTRIFPPLTYYWGLQRMKELRLKAQALESDVELNLTLIMYFLPVRP